MLREWQLHKKCWNISTIKILEQFWKTLEMPLTNCEVIVSTAVANQGVAVAITDAKLYVQHL